MNKFTHITLLVCTITAIVSPARKAFAGADSSGGGLTVVCFDDPAIPESLRKGDGLLTDPLLKHATSIENFDLYEAKLVRGLEKRFQQKLIPIHEGETAEQYALRILKRLEHSVPALYKMFTAPVTQSFVSESLEKMNDAHQVGLIDYENCMLATMGLNHVEDNRGFLKVDQRLYNHVLHSEQSRGVFLLHEQVYLAARRLGEVDSRHTRQLVNLLITRSDALSDEELEAGKTILTVRQLITKAKEFGFSGNERFRSYGAELIKPIIREALGVGLAEYKKFDPEMAKLLARLREAYKPFGLHCESDHLTPCFQPIYEEKIPELKGIGQEVIEFTKRRLTAVRDAMLAFYAGPRGKALIDAAAFSNAFPAAVFDRDLRENVIDQVAMQYTDAGLQLGAAAPLDVIDLDKVADRFALEVEFDFDADYPVEVVE